MNMFSLCSMYICVASYFIFYMNSPLNLSILMVSITLALIATISTITQWYAMVLFLIYIGGLMIMFSYFTSLSSNESKKWSNWIHLFALPYIFYKILTSWTFTNMYFGANMLMTDTPYNLTLAIFCGLVLLIMLLIVVMALTTKKSPLRGFSLY